MLLKAIAAAYDGLIVALAGCAALLLGCMPLWVTYDVLMRYFFQKPSIWVLDLSEYALLWAVFLASPWILRQDEHVRVDLVLNLLERRYARLMQLISSLLGMVVSAIFAWQAALVDWDLYVRGLEFAREWPVRQYVVYLVIPLGAALLSVEFAVRVIRIGGRTDTSKFPEKRTVL